MKNSFDPSEMAVMTGAIDEACPKPGHTDQASGTLTPMPLKRRSFRVHTTENVLRLISQAERARMLAAQCQSTLVADLFEMHAQLCERNAANIAVRPIGKPRIAAVT